MTVHIDTSAAGQGPPRRGGWASVRAVVRGLCAVAGLLLGAVDALVTALIGAPPLAWLAGRIGRELADGYRRGYHNAHDVEVVDDPNDPADHEYHR